jgi:hypothetical protein
MSVSTFLKVQTPLQLGDLMSFSTQQIRVELEDLCKIRSYVSDTLCRQNDFELGVFKITERILMRHQRPCGIFFCLHGPRSVKLTAVWEMDNNSILFYGSTGERVQKTKLSDDAAPAAANIR